jgi:hypothetical protein
MSRKVKKEETHSRLYTYLSLAPRSSKMVVM